MKHYLKPTLVISLLNNEDILSVSLGDADDIITDPYENWGL